MVEKVKTAIWKQDLRVELKKYPLSDSGNKIDIVNSGAGYFMPEIGPTNFLDWPKRKMFIFFGPMIYERIFFSIKKGSKCVDFLTGAVYGPDQEAIKLSNLNLLAKDLGSEQQKGIPWYIWAILILCLFNFLLVMRIAGVFA